MSRFPPLTEKESAELVEALYKVVRDEIDRLGLQRLVRPLGAQSIYRDIDKERIRQESLITEGKFSATCASTGAGSMNEAMKLVVLTEEVGEVARAICDATNNNHGSGKYMKRVREELVQVAAVAVAWIEAIDSEAP